MAGEHSPYLTRFTPIDFRIYLFIQKILEIKTSESQKSRTKTLLCSARPGSGLRAFAVGASLLAHTAVFAVMIMMAVNFGIGLVTLLRLAFGSD